MAPTIDAALDQTQRPIQLPASASSQRRTPDVTANSGAAHVVGIEQPGRYSSLREIGRGGMGRVTLVEDHQLGREVAMKELLAAVSADGAMSLDSVTRFLREARVTGQLEHPSIVPVHEIGRRADGTLYYTMKRIRGRSLADALREAGSLATRLKLVSAFRDVCHAVAYAHSRGVIHRDLKPDNVMVGEFGDTLVVDWGIAKVRGEPDANAVHGRVSVESVGDGIQTVDGHAIGTPAYMSPEQARGDLAAIDERSDVWGLGAILFEILTGRPPFVGKSALEVLSRVLEAPPPRVGQIAADAPPELAAIANRALAREPRDRYATARELVADITAFQEGALVGAYVYSGWERARRFVRRNRAATIAAATIAIAVLGASGFVTRSYFAERAARGRAEHSARSANVARQHAEQSDLRARSSLADALLEKADRALADGDPHAAAIFAAATLVRAARVGDDTAADEREDRARSVFADAEEAMHWTTTRGLDDVTAMSSVSPDGSRVAVPEESGIALIDVDTGDRTHVLAGRVDRVMCFVGPGRVLVNGARNGIVDLATGAFEHETPPARDAAVAGGKLAIAFADGRVEVRDLATWQALDTIETARRGWVRVALDPAGARLAVWSRDNAWVDVYPQPRVGTPRRFDVTSSPSRAAFSPDGAQLAVSVSGVGLRIIDTNGSAPVRVIPSMGWAGAIAWLAPDVVTNAESYRVAIRRLPGGELVEALRYPRSGGGGDVSVRQGRIFHLADGGSRRTTIFTRRDTRSRAPLQLGIDPIARIGEAPAPGATLPSRASDQPYVLVPDAQRSRVVVAQHQTITAVPAIAGNLGSATLLGRLPVDLGTVNEMALLPDGSAVVLTSLRAIAVVTDTAARVLVPTSAMPAGLSLCGIAVDATRGIVFATGARASTVVRVRLDGTRLSLLEAHDGRVFSVTLSPDGRALATASEDRTVRIWDLTVEPPTVARVLDGYAALASDARFSPDGTRLATADGIGTVRVHDVATGTLRRERRVHRDWVNRLAWSPDGALLGTASDDGTVRVVDAVTLRTLRILRKTGITTAPVILAGNADVVSLTHSSVTIDAATPATYREPAQVLLDRAQRAAGLQLDGLELVTYVDDR